MNIVRSFYCSGRKSDSRVQVGLPLTHEARHGMLDHPVMPDLYPGPRQRLGTDAATFINPNPSKVHSTFQFHDLSASGAASMSRDAFKTCRINVSVSATRFASILTLGPSALFISRDRSDLRWTIHVRKLLARAVIALPLPRVTTTVARSPIWPTSGDSPCVRTSPTRAWSRLSQVSIDRRSSIRSAE